jgi:hypothetical protein
MKRSASGWLAAGGLLVVVVAAAVAAATVLVWHVRYRRPQMVNGDMVFVTVERARSPGARSRFFPRPTPGLLVLTRLQDAASAEAYIRKSGLDGLRALDWDENFAIVVFLGAQAETLSTFEIVRVVRQDAEVHIYASTGLVDEEDIPTSPYHIVAVRKVGQWQGALTFRLFLDAGGEVAQVTAAVPESTIPLWPQPGP